MGYLPHPEDIDTKGLDIKADALDMLTSIDSAQCHHEMISLGEYLDSYGDRTPDELKRQQQLILKSLSEEIAKAS